MTEHSTACSYARHEGCFADHQGHPFHPESHLEALKGTAFSPRNDLLEEECDAHTYSLDSSNCDWERDEAQPGSILKKLMQQCKAVDGYSKLLPRWNDVYDSLAVPTELMEGFDIDLDVAKYREQMRS
ncbi:hypothetical protein E4U17_000420 [Claviceps sp. LM77 group G4]|nr:hypothetical protein E4U17_000420 [Claviceps sp. LM77 group G4]KAG6084241.1 hypothetical protein E4U33_003681 [Claviceps sp. LM78 group G4]KAG6085433.1 hypothetical protein E4U16_005404 [Claviceps sp. LM84 group G4]